MIDAVLKLKQQLFSEHILRSANIANYLGIPHEVNIRAHASCRSEFGLEFINDGGVSPIFASNGRKSVIFNNKCVALQCLEFGGVVTDLSLDADFRKLDVSDCVGFSPHHSPIIDQFGSLKTVVCQFGVLLRQEVLFQVFVQIVLPFFGNSAG